MRRMLLFLLLIAPAVQAWSPFAPTAGSLSVKLRQLEGPPWYGVAVSISSPGGLVVPSLTYTDRSGEAVFPVLCPGDDYEIRIDAEGHRPLVFEDISVASDGFKMLLINPYAPLHDSLIHLELHLGSVTREQEFLGEKPWVDVVSEQLTCPDGIYRIPGPLDRETLRWLRQGFAMKQHPDPADPVPPFVDEMAGVKGRCQRSNDHSSPASTSDWPGTRRLSGPSKKPRCSPFERS